MPAPEYLAVEDQAAAIFVIPLVVTSTAITQPRLLARLSETEPAAMKTLGNAVVVPVYAWRNNNRWDKPGAVWNAARSRWIANIAAFIGLRQFATCGNMPH
jgi:hypothetical protein